MQCLVQNVKKVTFSIVDVHWMGLFCIRQGCNKCMGGFWSWPAHWAHVACPLSWFLYRFMVRNDPFFFTLSRISSVVQSEAWAFILTKKAFSKFYVILKCVLCFLKNDTPRTLLSHSHFFVFYFRFSVFFNFFHEIMMSL